MEGGAVYVAIDALTERLQVINNTATIGGGIRINSIQKWSTKIIIIIIFDCCCSVLCRDYFFFRYY